LYIYIKEFQAFNKHLRCGVSQYKVKDDDNDDITQKWPSYKSIVVSSNNFMI